MADHRMTTGTMEEMLETREMTVEMLEEALAREARLEDLLLLLLEEIAKLNDQTYSDASVYPSEQEISISKTSSTDMDTSRRPSSFTTRDPSDPVDSDSSP